jgi:release factor glutamine methyltransferase
MSEIWTIQSVLRWTFDYFQNKNIPEARLSAEILLAKILNMKRLDLYLQFDRILTLKELDKYREFIRRRACNEPVQYILGEHEFMGLNFKVSPDVLIPRQETEILVEEVMKEIERNDADKIKILDVGTGSGVIAISLAHFYPNCNLTAIDISEKALEIAKKNSKNLGVSNIKFIQEDTQKLCSKSSGKCHISVSNPPYIPEEEIDELHTQVKNFEPMQALLAGRDGLSFISKLLPTVPHLLTKSGFLFMEIGINQSEKVKKLFEKHKYKNIEFIKDYQKIDRIIKAQQ